MTRVKVSEAANSVLDWMVAKAKYTDRRVELSPYGGVYFEHSPGSGDSYNMGWTYARFSTDWSQGGPIIDREGITTVRRVHNGAPDWWATTEVSDTSRDYEPMGLTGPAPLIAAMRCFVASRLGDEVDVPEELL